jgi:hypothetical protein
MTRLSRFKVGLCLAMGLTACGAPKPVSAPSSGPTSHSSTDRSASELPEEMERERAHFGLHGRRES